MITFIPESYFVNLSVLSPLPVAGIAEMEHGINRGEFTDKQDDPVMGVLVFIASGVSEVNRFGVSEMVEIFREKAALRHIVGRKGNPPLELGKRIHFGRVLAKYIGVSIRADSGRVALMSKRKGTPYEPERRGTVYEFMVFDDADDRFQLPSERSRERARRRIHELSDGYVKGLLPENLREVAEAIEVKRSIIKVKRITKEYGQQDTKHKTTSRAHARES